MTLNKHVKNAFQLLIIFLCAALIIFYFKGHAEEVRQIQKIKFADISLLFGLLFVAQIIYSYKILIAIRFLGLKNMNFVEWFKIVTVSKFVNQHLFQGANLYRSIKLKKDYQFSYTNSVGATLSFVWLETVSILVIAALIISLFLWRFPNEFPRILFYLFIILFAVFMMPFAMLRLAKYLSPRLTVKFGLREKITDISENVYKLLKEPRLLSFYALNTFLFVFVHIFTVRVGFNAIGIKPEFFQNLLFALVLILTRMFNIVPANIGISEVICGSISNAIKISFGSGVIVAGIVRVVAYVLFGMVTLMTYSSHFFRPPKNS